MGAVAGYGESLQDSCLDRGGTDGLHQILRTVLLGYLWYMSQYAFCSLRGVSIMVL